MKKLLSLCALLSICALYAQDPRERAYNYEVLTPSGVNKPKVELGTTKRIEESLDRGVTAVPSDKSIYLSWRLLKSDPEGVTFDVFRKENGKSKKLNKKPIRQTTDFIDNTVKEGGIYEYTVKVLGKAKGVESGNSANVELGTTKPYYSLKLKDDVQAGRIAICDLNGDGKWDFIVMHPNRGIDPGGASDTTGLTYKIDAYLNDGTFLWRYDLGQGIEPGVWYSPFIVYDFDGDGKAEVAIKTAENKPREGKKSKYGWMAFGNWSNRDAFGRVLNHKEYLSIIDGMTGKEVTKVDWIERSPRLGDYNRNNRNQMGMAFLDGKTPCILSMRGTYRAMRVDAWQYKNGKLFPIWQWDGDEENPVIRSQGAHQSQSADIDGDGRDEVILGSVVLDDNGTMLWSAGVGHPDKAIVTDIDPTRPGMEILFGQEVWHEERGVIMVDAATGKEIWRIGTKTMHVGDAMAADIDPTKPGLECWATEDSKGGQPNRYMFDSKGKLFKTGNDVPGCRNWIWWDADRLRETFMGDGYNRPTWTAEQRDSIKKARESAQQSNAVRTFRPSVQSIVKYGSKEALGKIEGNIGMIGDFYGDWREEVMTVLPGEIRIYSTDIPAKDRMITLLQDSKYRIDLVNRSQGYPQSPTPTFYIGE